MIADAPKNLVFINRNSSLMVISIKWFVLPISSHVTILLELVGGCRLIVHEVLYIDAAGTHRCCTLLIC